MSEPLARTISSQVIVRLRGRILAGAYAPGAPLLQDAIAAEFGISKIPVREALVQLQGGRIGRYLRAPRLSSAGAVGSRV